MDKEFSPYLQIMPLATEAGQSIDGIISAMRLGVSKKKRTFADEQA